jgi:hypothetical protein
MQVVAISDEPWMEGDVLNPATGYSNSRRVTLHFAIVYLNVPWPASISRPSSAAGTTLKLKTRFGGQYQPLPPAAIQPAAGPVPGPNTQQAVYYALNEYNVEWDRVIAAAVPDFTGYAGAVNSDSFMGCDPGQLFCAGASQEPSYILDPTHPLSWKTTVTLKQKKIVVAGGGVYGWNDWYNPKTQQWEALSLTNGQPPYNPVAFSGMFL